MITKDNYFYIEIIGEVGRLYDELMANNMDPRDIDPSWLNLEIEANMPLAYKLAQDEKGHEILAAYDNYLGNQITDKVLFDDSNTVSMYHCLNSSELGKKVLSTRLEYQSKAYEKRICRNILIAMVIFRLGYYYISNMIMTEDSSSNIRFRI